MEDIKIKNIDTSSDKTEQMENFFRDKIPEKEIVCYEPKLLKKILRFIAYTAFVLAVGGLGGVIADRWAISYLVAMPAFSKYSWLERIKENTIIMKTTEEVKISEDLVMVDSISKMKSSVVKMVVSYNLEQKSKSRSKKPIVTETVTESVNGVIVTSDGLVLAMPSFFIPPEVMKDKELKDVSYKVILSDKREFVVNEQGRIFSNLLQTPEDNPVTKAVILKIDASNLPVIAFGDTSGLLLGDHTAIVGQGVAIGAIAKIDTVLAEGSNDNPKSASWKIIYFDRDITNKDFYAGAPLINLKGEVMGVNIVNSDGGLTNAFISMDDLKPFINAAIGKKQ